MNKFIGIGNLGRDPELKFTQTGKAVTSFSIAISEKWADASGQRQEKTEWLNIVVWNKTAENCAQYLFKGSKVAVDGKVSTRSYEDKSGTKKYVTEIIADRVEFLSTKSQASGDSSGSSTVDSLSDDDIPF